MRPPSRLHLAIKIGCCSGALLAGLCIGTPGFAGDVRVGLSLSDDIYVAPIFAAEKLGLFRISGLTVRRVPIRGIDVGVEALTAGNVDLIDAPGPAAAIATDKGLPGKIVASNAAGFYGWTIIVNKTSGYQSIRELSGKRFGITTSRSLSGLAALLAMDRSGTTFAVQAVGAGALIPMLRNNKLEAVISHASLGLREVAAGRARIVYDLSLGEQSYTVSTLIAANAMMEHRPSELRAFLAARARALQYMQENRKWSITLLKEYANLVDTALVERMYDNIIRRMQSAGRTDPAALKAAIIMAAKAWSLPEIAKIEPGKLFTNEFAPPAN